MENEKLCPLLKVVCSLALLVSVAAGCDRKDESSAITPNVAAIARVADSAQVEKGLAIYLKQCVWCHGTAGQGDGPAAPYLVTKPTNFPEGLFKIRSTAPGELPTDGDLFETLRFGLPGSAMPSYDKVLSHEEMAQVIAFVKTVLVTKRKFNDPNERFTVSDTTGMPSFSVQPIQRGKVVYQKAKCGECHGSDGRGDGNLTLKDAYDRLILSADLTQPWNFRGNRGDPYNPVHVYRTLSTGMNGTPMAEYQTSLSKEERWDLANFVLSLSPRLKIDPRTKKPELQFILRSKHLKGAELPADANDAQWQSLEPLRVAMAPQLVHKPRHFLRPIESIQVRSLYNDNEIAFLFEWNDRTKSFRDDKRRPLYDARALNVVAEFSFKEEGSSVGTSNDAIAIQFPGDLRKFIAREQARIEETRRILKSAGLPDTSPKDLLDRLRSIPSDSTQSRAMSNVPRSIKPFFLYGDQNNGVDVWKWEADSTVRIINGHGIRQLIERKDQLVQLVFSSHENGRWRVLIKRDLKKEAEDGFELPLMQHIPISFFVWDGDAGEVDGQMAHSTYYYLVLDSDRPDVKRFTSFFSRSDEPFELRTVHPAPPEAIDVHGQRIVLSQVQNPYRVDDEGRYLDGREKEYRKTWFTGDSKFGQSVQKGAALYFGKGACFLCHGPLLDGGGPSAWAVTPLPLNFLDVGTIAQLQESYVFWRIAKGGTGLPEQSFPWASSMPPAEDQLSSDEIWKVTLFIYVASGYYPQLWN